MGLKADLIATLTANLDATQRGRLTTAYIATFSLKNPDGSEPTTNVQKGDAVARWMIQQMKATVLGYEDQVNRRAVATPPPVMITE